MPRLWRSTLNLDKVETLVLTEGDWEMMRMCRLGLSILFIYVLVGCGEEAQVVSLDSSEEAGIFLQIMLEDEKEQEISYVLFNPNVKTLEACNVVVEAELDNIVKKLPPEYSGSTVTGWSCSLSNPEAGKIKIDRVDA